MRITTNSMIQGYKRHISIAYNNTYAAQEKVLTNRRFNSGREDPTGAYREAQLNRSYVANETYLDVVKESQSRLDLTSTTLTQINTMAVTVSKEGILSGLNGSMDQAARETIISQVKGMQKTMVNVMNNSYDGKYIFAGADAQNPPFAYDETTNVLTFRGIDVSSPEKLPDGSDNPDYLKLKELASETLYIDLGFGFKNDASGKILDSSAFNLSNPGINSIGFGTNANGDSKNMIVQLGEMAKELANEPVNTDRIWEINNEFKQSLVGLTDSNTSLGVKVKFLEDTEDRMKDTRIALSEQISNVSGIELPEAMMDFSWNMYVYNSALKIGNSILTPSFIDFMN